MTVASWPAELPRPMRQSYQFGRGDGRLRTPQDAGPPRTRLRYSAVPSLVAMTVDLSVDETLRLDRFYDEEVGRGSLPFLMPDPELDGLVLSDGAGNVLTDGAGAVLTIAATWLCMFADGLPARTVVGVRRRVSFQIAVLP